MTRAAYEQALKDEFDQLYEEGATWRRMMGMALHDRISGHANRVRVLDHLVRPPKYGHSFIPIDNSPAMTDHKEDEAPQDPAPIEPGPAPRSVFLAFQGGGARGISHVGGLAAINALGMKVEGVAGTSAGAIMAALVAAGYRADQLLDPANETHLLQRVADGQFKRATQLFTDKGWSAVWRLRFAAKTLDWLTGGAMAQIRHAIKRLEERYPHYLLGVRRVIVAGAISGWGRTVFPYAPQPAADSLVILLMTTRVDWLGVRDALARLVNVSKRMATPYRRPLTKARQLAWVAGGVAVGFILDRYVSRPALAILLVLLALLAWAVVSCLSGLASLDAVHKLIDDAIGEGLKIAKRGITFEELDAEGGLPLKLVATNVTTQSLELFSVETTPKAKVADAVAASICLPIAFEPWSFPLLRQGQESPVVQCFIDGGLVSNLPVWTFDEERALQPDTVTVAFGLAAQEPASGPPHWLPAALHTVVAGPPEIHFRGVDRLLHFPLPSGIRVLDFDASFGTLASEVSAATTAARAFLERYLTVVPAAIRESLVDMQRNISKELRDAFPDEFAARDELEPPLVRIALAIQKRTERLSLAIAYEVDHIESQRGAHFSLKTSVLGEAWLAPQPELRFYGTEPDPARIYDSSAWAFFARVVQNEEELGDDQSDPLASKLAVVAIIDSRTPLPDTIMGSVVQLTKFSETLEEAAGEFFAQNKVGGLYRRSIAWL
ncbi:patatin-like phospholipase family protein [Burkholderia gladioli]|uniref:patatin-like phospholipase family protein n=1 Tax=Burkholderia gladioli TaxID=28095 RepID=UPI00163FE371|nr:patatin-like phospholipase family protein [Burkholderia gladioli]